MSPSNNAYDDHATMDAGLVDQPGAGTVHHGVARDIFSDARWTPVDPVRARNWHDHADGAGVRATETDFD